MKANPRAALRILVACDAFKGSASASQVNQAIALGLGSTLPDAVVCCLPLADGGEGTLDVLAAALGLPVRTSEVHPQDGECREARWACDGTLALIESAQVCGWQATSDVMRASSVGVGELMKEAVERGAQELWIGLGGSSSVDGGVGMLQALGAELLDAQGRPIAPGGGGLAALHRVDLAAPRRLLEGVELRALCDVRSPLLGAHGARMFMAQKGADPAQSDLLEEGLRRLADRAEDPLAPSRGRAGTGAAGGLGFGLALLGAELVDGAHWVLDAVGFDAHLQDIDLVITGEGRIDAQTSQGKLIDVVLSRAKAAGVPVFALCGELESSVETKSLEAMGLAAAFSIAPGPQSLEAARQKTLEQLERTAAAVGGVLNVSWCSS